MTKYELSGRKKGVVGYTGKVLLAYLIVLFFMAPFLYLILNSFKNAVDIQSYPPSLLFSPTIKNYAKVFGELDILPFITNSLIVAVTVTVIALLLALPASYALTRYNFKGRDAIANAFLIIQLAPAVSMILPFFLMINNLGLYNTKIALIIVYLPWNIPFAVFMLRGFIETTPLSVEEAGMMDGCTRFKAFLYLTIPQLYSGLLATVIFTFIGAWNEFLLAYFLTSSKSAQTLPTTVDFFLTFGNYQFGPMFAAAVLGTMPVVIFAFIVRKYYIIALTGGSVKE